MEGWINQILNTGLEGAIFRSFYSKKFFMLKYLLSFSIYKQPSIYFYHIYIYIYICVCVCVCVENSRSEISDKM